VNSQIGSKTDGCSFELLMFGADVVSEGGLHSRSSSVDSSSQLSSHHHHHQQQQQQLRHSTPTPTPSDDAVTPTLASARVVSSPKDSSSMDAGKSTMWLGTEDGW